jgi:hypothetical protein
MKRTFPSKVEYVRRLKWQKTINKPLSKGNRVSKKGKVTKITRVIKGVRANKVAKAFPMVRVHAAPVAQANKVTDKHSGAN